MGIIFYVQLRIFLNYLMAKYMWYSSSDYNELYELHKKHSQDTQV